MAANACDSGDSRAGICSSPDIQICSSLDFLSFILWDGVRLLSLALTCDTHGTARDGCDLLLPPARYHVALGTHRIRDCHAKIDPMSEDWVPPRSLYPRVQCPGPLNILHALEFSHEVTHTKFVKILNGCDDNYRFLTERTYPKGTERTYPKGMEKREKCTSDERYMCVNDEGY